MKFSSTFAQLAYVAACLVVPGLWGAVSAWLFTRRDRKAEEARARDRQPIDYVI